MHLCRKYRPVALCAAIGLILFMVHFMVYYLIVFEEPIDMEFYDDPFNWECGPNAKLLRTVEYMECLEENPIFFVETSDSPRVTARVACAVESAARHHPDRQVRILFLSPEPLDFKDPFTESLTHLGNVRLLRVDLGVLFRGTPLLYWYKKGKFKYSPYKISHTSDAMRLFLVWKYGGMYLDSDIVVLHSLSHLHNTTTTDNGKNLGFALIAFDPDHPLFRDSIMDFAANYSPYEFAANGPQLFTRNFRKRCHVEIVAELYVGGQNSCDVNVLPQEAAYPISYKTWQEYFKPQTTHNETVFESSLIIHVWNMLSNGGKLIVGQNSLYEMSMKEHCPKVYEHVAKVGYA
ncbi:unnamed protein product [Larinioides sclopetarius]|uniref:Alpha 1,4-glycosyltransferase domain-containing protein n=2 Tax=Larinioides sclopetarius TaxID=280406 RepID=A0AAV1Z5P0_9ARAC